jgi:hypothetical protein
MSDQEKQEVKQDVEVTQETPAVAPAPMPEWKPPEKYEVKQNTGYGFLLVVLCVLLVVGFYFAKQYNESNPQQPTQTSS